MRRERPTDAVRDWYVLVPVSSWVGRYDVRVLRAASELQRGRDPVSGRCYRHGVTKAELHELVDALPDESLSAVATLLRRARDPVVAKLDAAAYDDEELTGADWEAVREARSEPGVAWSAIETELGAA